MDYQSFKHLLLKGTPKNVYLFSGVEIGDKKEALSIFKQRLFGNESPTVYTFYCDSEFVPANFLNAIQTAGLFSSTKLILLKGIEQAKDSVIKTLTSLLIPQSFEAAHYEEIFARFPKEINQLNTYYEKKDNRYFLKKIKETDKKKIIDLFAHCNFSPLDKDSFLIVSDETNEKIPDAVTRLFPETQTIQFFEMFENKKADWTRTEFAKYNLSIDNNSVSLLLDMVENNKSALEQEIGNIAAMILQKDASQKNITHDLIEEYLYHSKEESTFSLFSALVAKKRDKALEILDKLFIAAPDGILSGLLWSQRRAVRILDLYENMKQPKELIFRELFINGKKAQQELSLLIANFSFRHAVYALNRLSQLEYFLRVLPANLKLIQLQLFILDYIDERIDRDFLQGELQFVVS
ncbi:MAG: hypothetical protein J1G30_03430 [Spirochaetales bacterium]|nr:hypothetical protein [Spirochaetales bacterium]